MEYKHFNIEDRDTALKAMLVHFLGKMGIFHIEWTNSHQHMTIRWIASRYKN